ncbi:hypothetical protein Lal_00004725 [Lupinus albus]|uniref:Putative Blue (Type 1) copper binding protein n=1 Tax=Lupinus albus TaxID=3870 RepID=A0A6A5LTE9_LUPAL|nr:putative Blue (type 1) copper binding protein [Lupinus albus]KAE9587125.1 putative Blue (type 1) copper binding protein [Lupinus albus]KAF1865351.1 hypothetical protein Lal_00004725 [Lupinus albus]
MTFSNVLSLAILVAINIAMPTLAAIYTVGDNSGWTIGADYSTWTSDKTFSVGDSLVFNYGAGHTVDEVKESDYKSCTTGNSISTDSSGATTIALKSEGTHYFICAIPGHCAGGMKLAVTVKAGKQTTPSTTPSSSSSGKGSPSDATTDTPTTQSSTKSNASSASSASPFIAMLGHLLCFASAMRFN